MTHIVHPNRAVSLIGRSLTTMSHKIQTSRESHGHCWKNTQPQVNVLICTMNYPNITNSLMGLLVSLPMKRSTLISYHVWRWYIIYLLSLLSSWSHCKEELQKVVDISILDSWRMLCPWVKSQCFIVLSKLDGFIRQISDLSSLKFIVCNLLKTATKCLSF